MKNIIFIAPPAAGKGTVSAEICREYNIPHISTGDLLREEIAKGTKIGMAIKESIARGELASDELITKLLKKRLSAKDCHKGYVLDGYPRNTNQAVIYDEILKELGYDMGKVVYLEISKEEALKRSMSRLICPKCSLSYNTLADDLRPIKEGICDSCGTTLKVRSDDNEETFGYRYDTYMNETYPLIMYYKDRNNLSTVNVEGKSASEVLEEVRQVIK